MLTANWTVDGMSAYVSGQGPGIVLLHSLLADRGSLEPMIPLLEKEFRVVLLDLPGFGLSKRCKPTLDAHADCIARTVEQLFEDEKPLLFGNGFGSFLALATALRHPERVRALCLAGCGAAFSETGRQSFRFMASKAREAGLEAIADVAMRRLFPPQLSTDFPEIAAERRARFLDTDLDVFCEACNVLATLDLSEAARTLSIPLIACAGSLDEATPASMAEELATLVPRGVFERIENCAHIPPLQAPDAVNAILRKTFEISR